MLLAIDIGNSNVVIGCLDSRGKVLCTLRMVTDPKKTEDEYAAAKEAEEIMIKALELYYRSLHTAIETASEN